MRMHRILIVEDDSRREQTLRAWLPADFRPVVATSAGAAIGILRLDAGRVYAAIMLDHDLQARRASEADLHLSGSDVVEAVRAYVSREVPILIHSMNATERGRMALELDRAGFDVTVTPMEDLSRERLAEWIDTVRHRLDGE